ncbi:MAG: hypothetical protein RLP02_15095 [Coleofasciculus sp. C2-GNP5-27]
MSSCASDVDQARRTPTKILVNFKACFALRSHVASPIQLNRDRPSRWYCSFPSYALHR